MLNFFKPTIFKIVLMVILIALTFFIPKNYAPCSRGTVCDNKMIIGGFGYPMFYGTEWHGDYGEYVASPSKFGINLILHYTLSSLIIFIYWKIKNKQNLEEKT